MQDIGVACAYGGASDGILKQVENMAYG